MHYGSCLKRRAGGIAGETTALAAQYRFTVEMTGKEKEVVDVELPVLAATVRPQRTGILQPAGIELLHADHIAVFQEEAPIGFAPEEFEHQARRLGAMAILRLHQK